MTSPAETLVRIHDIHKFFTRGGERIDAARLRSTGR
jgi:hypothetical protein